MTLHKPLHRIFRPVKTGPNAGYSSVGYITDRGYANNPEHYVRAYLLIQKELKQIFEYIEPSAEGESAFSYRVHALLMRVCIEVEANFKAILDENIFSHPKGRSLSMKDYRKIDASHHLSSFEIILPIWSGGPRAWKPFLSWYASRGKPAANLLVSLPWYQAYNDSKHDRHGEFKKANLGVLVEAVAGLQIVIASQFAGEDFSAGEPMLALSGLSYHPMEPTVGDMFRIKYPDDWDISELYDFDWSKLKTATDKFDKFNYDIIPY